MYKKLVRQSVIRIPPEYLSKEILPTIERLTHINFEGKMDKNNNLTVLVTNIEPVGTGKIVHGDGAVYQNVKYEALVFEPQLHEIIFGSVCEILKFGAFVRFGPLDGLLHISQIMDDHIDIDLENERLLGKETKRELKVGDKVRARIVSISINERNPRESRIGLTMRQPGLGKVEWLDDEIKKAEGGDKAEEKGKKTASKDDKKKEDKKK
jgi:DNA-directed RNA polymerase subunit E'